jgi:ABC-type transport system involved in multi-copper enzyme maturation permease subunit
VVVGILAVFGIGGFFVARDPMAVVRSLPDLFRPALQETRFTVAPTPRIAGEPDESAEHVQVVNWRRDQLGGFQVESTERVSVFAQPFDANVAVRTDVEASQGDPGFWSPGDQARYSMFPDNDIEKVYLVNYGATPAEVTLTANIRPRYPQVVLTMITAVSVLGLFLVYQLQSILLPKASAVALATFKSEVASPLFAIELLVGVVTLLLFIWIPYNTFCEDIKMLKESGLELIRVQTIFMAVWAASSSVADEIEGRTALTVLSKPIGRRSFIGGKIFGISWTVALMYLILGVVLLIIVSYKPIYDARESSEELPQWEVCFTEMVRTTPGLLLGFMETLVLAALSVAISTRLPMLPNFVISFSIYVMGHIVPLLAHTSDRGFPVVRFFAQLLSAVFPNLDHFSIEAAISTGAPVPWSYLGWSLIYCVLFSLIATLLALLFFEDRDVA